MPNYRDYELMNESMRYMGNSFANQRQQKIENANRTRALDTADRRTDVEDARYTAANDLAQKRLDEGQTEAWLSGEDGGTVQYKGSPQGLQQLQDQAQAKGKPLKVVNKPDKNAKIGSFRTVTPLGELTFNLETAADVDHVMGLAKQIGGQGKQPGEFNTAQTRNTEYQSKLEADVANAQTPEAAAAAARKLEIFKSQKTSPEDMETVSEKFPAVSQQDAIPEVKDNWFTKTTPAVPAVAAAPERTVTRRVPVSGNTPAIAPMPTTRAATAPAAGGKVRVISPQGKPGSIPATQVQEALQQGYKLAPQQ